jgi:pimeloyl-ACP methyl ester carboxylesterase
MRDKMSTVISKDGTEIAYTKQGSGPAVILVEGALGYRSFGVMPQLAERLAPRFTAFTYDRRGRGESGNSTPFAVAREVEDIAALNWQAGGESFIFGISSGACLALEAAIRLGDKIKKLAMYEPPYDSAEATRPAWQEYRQRLDQLLGAGRRGDAVALFMQFVGVPADQVDGMR